MYYSERKSILPGTRKLLTISLPPPLLKKAERVAREENRTKSELVREALRFYVETREVRRTATQDRLAELLAEARRRSRSTPPPKVRKVIRQAIGAVRAKKASQDTLWEMVGIARGGPGRISERADQVLVADRLRRMSKRKKAGT
jgi:predicted transcriptional regulator